MSFLQDFSQVIRSSSKNIFESLCDNNTTREWFPELYVTETNAYVDIEKLRSDNIQYIVRIDKKIPHSFIGGTIESIDNSQDKLSFGWKLEQNSDQKDWTLLTMNFTEPQTITKNRWWAISTVGTISISMLLTTGSASMSSAYAATATNSATISSPIASEVVSTSSTSAKSAAVLKKTFSVIMASIVAIGGGIIIADAYYSDPNIEYSVDPAQMPAELHGVSLTVNNIYSTDEKSEIISYDCDNESVVYDLDYSFECITENSLGNKESVITDISIRAPDNRLGEDAAQCVYQYNYTLSDDENDVTKDYPYLLNLPNISPSSLSNYKNTHIKLMDDHFGEHDYLNAKKHATIVLKYFDINDIQALSTLGNVMRDEDRNDVNGVQCAITVHSTSFISNTVWGKLSLAEDYHVLGDYDASTFWSSQIIDEYGIQTDDEIHEISYVNSLIVKANALYRQALIEQNGFDEAKSNYSQAHNISQSYDTWFGLGNIDRHEGNFADALEKYEEAKKLVIGDTTEIDEAINRVSFISDKVS